MIRETIDQITSELEDFKQEFLDEFLTRVRRRTPVITGTLLEGWDGDITPDIVVTNDVPYASYVEYGTTRMAPRRMLTSTIEEADQIAELAASRAGLKD